jgi:uncharacterized membrane protein YhaH (DUF805 family)
MPGALELIGSDPSNLTNEVVLEIMLRTLVPVLIVALVFLWPNYAICTKRWHDRGKSGWWSLIILIPIIGAIWMLVECGFLSGEDGSNHYGPNASYA